MNSPKSSSNPYTLGIAQFVAGLRYEAIPSDVRDRIKLLILDSLGCAIFGTRLEWSRILLSTLASVDSSTGCGVWATDQRLSAPHAALVNGTLVQSFELDDVHRVADKERVGSGKEAAASCMGKAELPSDRTPS